MPCDLEIAAIDAYADLNSLILEHYGRLDGLLHNASLLGPRVPLEFYDAASWRRVMNVNVEAMFLLTQASAAGAAPVRRRIGRDHVVERRAGRARVLGRLCGIQICGSKDSRKSSRTNSLTRDACVSRR